MSTPTTPAPTVLDRELPLGDWARRAAPWSLVLGLALAVRLYGLRTYPLNSEEAALAFDAIALVTGGDLTPAAWAQPLPTVLAGMSFFLFGPGDGAARLVSLSAAMLAIVATIRLQPLLGRAVTLASAWFLALAPTLVLASTRLDGGILLLPGTFFLIASLERDSPSRRTALAVGATLALLPLAHPLGWLLSGACIAGLVLRWRQQAASLALAATSGIVTLTVVSTALLTRPQGLAWFLRESWSSLWHDFLSHPAVHWTRPLVLLATDEFPLACCTILGLVLTHQWAARRFGLLAVPFAVIVILFGHGSLTALVLLIATLTPLAGSGLAALVRAIPWAALRQQWDAAALGASALAVLIGLSLLGRLLAGPEPDALTWSAGVVSLVLLLAVALWIAANVWRRARVPQRTLLVLPLVAVAILASRNAMLVNATTSYRPGTVLHAGDTAPGLLVAIDRIRRASMELTMFQFDPRDPTGGHGLEIVVESSVAQPIAWYLRDFPRLHLVESSGLATAASRAQVVIVPASQQPTVTAVRPELVWQPLPYALTVPPTLESPPWQRLVLGVIDPRGWREYISFLLYRRVVVPIPAESVLVGLSPDVAAQGGFPAVP